MGEERRANKEAERSKFVGLALVSVVGIAMGVFGVVYFGTGDSDEGPDPGLGGDTATTNGNVKLADFEEKAARMRAKRKAQKAVRGPLGAPKPAPSKQPASAPADGGAPETEPASQPAPPPPRLDQERSIHRPPAPEGVLGRESVERGMELFRPMAQRCYEDLLDDFPDASGRLTLRFTVQAEDGTGVVVMSEIDRDKTEVLEVAFHDCLSRRIGKVEFEADETGSTEVAFPYVFEPGNPDDDEEEAYDEEE